MERRATEWMRLAVIFLFVVGKLAQDISSDDGIEPEWQVSMVQWYSGIQLAVCYGRDNTWYGNHPCYRSEIWHEASPIMMESDHRISRRRNIFSYNASGSKTGQVHHDIVHGLHLCLPLNCLSARSLPSAGIHVCGQHWLWKRSTTAQCQAYLHANFNFCSVFMGRRATECVSYGLLSSVVSSRSTRIKVHDHVACKALKVWKSFTVMEIVSVHSNNTSWPNIHRLD